ncbi:hypothetical protein [Rhodanobacter sp. DHG33]|uniref:hypothetical protein n=1 Tax=Rhodanobacter sp. DHG33 TaxID=2775921 RepID=UPI001786C0A7|nr:hypothetical protein [Rhodanobacter sp. DHG33]MBD8897915.1 hypothetical protein [Rhodanobacter sp. DHG33]
MKVLTDNDSNFTGRFTAKGKQPTGHHTFDSECALLAIEHRLIKSHHLQANGIVECFNGRISDALAPWNATQSSTTTICRMCVWIPNASASYGAMAMGTP